MLPARWVPDRAVLLAETTQKAGRLIVHAFVHGTGRESLRRGRRRRAGTTSCRRFTEASAFIRDCPGCSEKPQGRRWCPQPEIGVESIHARGERVHRFDLLALYPSAQSRQDGEGEVMSTTTESITETSRAFL